MKKLNHDVARRDHYEELTNKIIAKLEDGVLPWRRPWDPRKCSAGAEPDEPRHRVDLSRNQPLRSQCRPSLSAANRAG